MSKEKFKQILANGYCHQCPEGSTRPGEPEHTCPYAVDIFGDDEVLCNCCEECVKQCAHDI